LSFINHNYLKMKKINLKLNNLILTPNQLAKVKGGNEQKDDSIIIEDIING